MQELLKQCGHRIASHHFIKIRKAKKVWKLRSEGEALRKIIDEVKI